jgi:hypothetical protein
MKTPFQFGVMQFGGAMNDRREVGAFDGTGEQNVLRPCQGEMGRSA